MMTRLLGALVPAVAMIAAACSSAGDDGGPTPRGDGSPGAALTQTGEAGAVTVDATWLTADSGDTGADLTPYPLTQFVVIEIAFTTHSGDLTAIEMERAAALTQGDGRLQPEAWVSLDDDSHHRKGVLVFPRDLTGGPVDLVLQLVDGQVALRWETVPKA